MPSAAEECCEPSGKLREFRIVWRVITVITGRTPSRAACQYLVENDRFVVLGWCPTCQC